MTKENQDKYGTLHKSCKIDVAFDIQGNLRMLPFGAATTWSNENYLDIIVTCVPSL